MPSGLPAAAYLIALQFQFVKLGLVQLLQESGRDHFRMQTSSLRVTAARGRCMAKVTVHLTSDSIIYQTITKISKLPSLNSTRKIINHSG